VLGQTDTYRQRDGQTETDRLVDRQTDTRTPDRYTDPALHTLQAVPVMHLLLHINKKLSYCRGTARCVVSVEILPIATQQCRNYLYNKSCTKYQLSLLDPCDKIVL